MINLKKIITPYLLRPKVIHRLPGRLRIRISAIQYIPQHFDGIANELINKIKFADGIQSVDYNFISGNLLIHYQVSHTNETNILNWLNKLCDFIMEIESEISKLP